MTATAVFVALLVAAVFILKGTNIAREEAYLRAEVLLAEGKLGEAAIAFGKLGDFSDAREQSFAIWDWITIRDTVSLGSTAVLRNNGSVVAVESKYYSQCDVESWTDVVAIAVGDWHTVGLRADGTVVACGSNGYGQRNVSDWTDIRLPYERVPFR